MGRVVVVGSINVDLVAYAERLPRRGETVRGDGFVRFPGGKGANQAVAAARAGAETAMIGAVGDDESGLWMRDTLAREGIDLAGVETMAAPTGVALIAVGGGDNQIVVVPGANDGVDPGRVAAMPIAPGDVCVAQLETPMATVRAAFERAKAQGAMTLFNPAPVSAETRDLLPLTDVIVVNETECAFLAGRDTPATATDLADMAVALALRPAQLLVLTLGAAGLAAWQGEAAIRLPGHRVAAIDSTGAGDCFVGTLAAALCRGEDIAAALKEANAAAALSVTAKGALASFPDRARVTEFLATSRA